MKIIDLLDRNKLNIGKSQTGFIDFLVSPTTDIIIRFLPDLY